MKTWVSISLPPIGVGLRCQGSVLIIVLWIVFGLVSLALYFGHSMVFNLRAADQNAAGVQADQVIEGAARYLTFVLTNTALLGQLPDTNYYRCAAVPVGEGAFWLIGRDNSDQTLRTPVYGLVDEGSKLNLNTATLDMLEMLPRMTPEFAAAIIDWRDTDEDVTIGGAESETYLRLNPPYFCKNAPFESLDELRLVEGVTSEILFGEDSNLNGVLDPNENDGAVTLPDDNRDGLLDPGIFEYLTVYSREPNKRSDGTARVSVNSTNELASLLQERLADRAQAIQQAVSGQIGSFRSVLQFFVQSGMTAQEFAQVAADLTVTNAAYVEGLINVNTAPEPVLACIPGIGLEKAPQIVAFRQSKTTNDLYSVAWVMQVLDQASALQAGPYITTFSYQFSADVVAVGSHGRGYRRTLFVFDTSEDQPKIIYRRDRARLGWALGAELPPTWLAGKEIR